MRARILAILLIAISQGPRKFSSSWNVLSTYSLSAVERLSNISVML